MESRPNLNNIASAIPGYTACYTDHEPEPVHAWGYFDDIITLKNGVSKLEQFVEAMILEPESGRLIMAKSLPGFMGIIQEEMK